jgi:hypothetical protein
MRRFCVDLLVVSIAHSPFVDRPFVRCTFSVVCSPLYVRRLAIHPAAVPAPPQPYRAAVARVMRSPFRPLLTAVRPATSAPGLRSPLPHLRRDCAQRFHICAGTGLTPAAAAPRLLTGLTLPHLHRDWAHPCRICNGTGLAPVHICTRTGLGAPTSAPGLGSALPHLHRDWAHRSHLHRDWALGLVPAARQRRGQFASAMLAESGSSQASAACTDPGQMWLRSWANVAQSLCGAAASAVCKARR